jgi:hypothetical protein
MSTNRQKGNSVAVSPSRTLSSAPGVLSQIAHGDGSYASKRNGMIVFDGASADPRAAVLFAGGVNLVVVPDSLRPHSQLATEP